MSDLAERQDIADGRKMQEIKDEPVMARAFGRVRESAFKVFSNPKAGAEAVATARSVSIALGALDDAFQEIIDAGIRAAADQKQQELLDKQRADAEARRTSPRR